ncbi:hypothetical protein SSX86_031321, partial [Deinandra increscens subsp. villosa]
MRLAALETASLCAIIRPSTIIPAAGSITGAVKSYNRKCDAQCLTFSPPTCSYRQKSKQLNSRVNAANASSGSGSTDPDDSTKQLAVLLEIDGVLMDVYRYCNREAFNLAFKKMGLDCAHWTEPIYLDLV